jgi:hypothetical protein
MDNGAEMETNVNVRLTGAIFFFAGAAHDIIAQVIFYNEFDQAH